jgi:hypothetical protein
MMADGLVSGCPPGIDDDVVADAAGDVVVQAEADDAVVAGAERPDWIDWMQPPEVQRALAAER